MVCFCWCVLLLCCVCCLLCFVYCLFVLTAETTTNTYVVLCFFEIWHIEVLWVNVTRIFVVFVYVSLVLKCWNTHVVWCFCCCCFLCWHIEFVSLCSCLSLHKNGVVLVLCVTLNLWYVVYLKILFRLYYLLYSVFMLLFCCYPLKTLCCWNVEIWICILFPKQWGTNEGVLTSFVVIRSAFQDFLSPAV